jgi:hypothetical protein
MHKVLHVTHNASQLKFIGELYRQQEPFRAGLAHLPSVLQDSSLLAGLVVCQATITPIVCVVVLPGASG